MLSEGSLTTRGQAFFENEVEIDAPLADPGVRESIKSSTSAAKLSPRGRGERLIFFIEH